MKAEADAFAQMQGLLGSEETAPHRGLATLLGETLGFKGNTWSQDFRDATHMDEPVMQKILAGLRGMGRRPSQFGDTALTELVGGFNIAEDRAIAGATAGQDAALKAFEADTARIIAEQGKPPSGAQQKLIQQTGLQIQAAGRLKEIQDLMYETRGGLTGGGARGVGHGIGSLVRWLGFDPKVSEEHAYKALRANVNSLMVEAGLYDERYNKNMVKQLVDKALPETGWRMSHSELADAVQTLLSTVTSRIGVNQKIIEYGGHGDILGALHESAELGKGNPYIVKVEP
tara:strand:- start:671 stop:1531 length:861 start_codon:yes stop_codon:yes gene_type:complete